MRALIHEEPLYLGEEVLFDEVKHGANIKRRQKWTHKYRGTSLLRKLPSPYDRRKALGMGLP